MKKRGHVPAEKEILDYLSPSFAEAWHHIEAARELGACFIDAVAIIRMHPDDTAQIAIGTPEFEELVKPLNHEIPDNIFMMVARLDRQYLLDACRKAVASQATQRVDARWHRFDEAGNESFFPSKVAIDYIGTAEEDALLYFAVQDMSYLVSRTTSLSKKQYADILSSVFEEVFMLDLDTGEHSPVYMNGLPLVGEDGEEIECGFHRLSELMHPDDRSLFWQNSNYTRIGRILFDECTATSTTFDLRRMEEDGKYHWCSIQIIRVESNDTHRRVLVCARNVDEQKAAQRRERELRSKAQTDSLTGIFNRGTTEELIMATMQAQLEGALLIFALVDVDNFKGVNDTYGHSTGDDVLKAVANCMKGIGKEKDIIGRIGGDEFAILFVCDGDDDEDSVQDRVGKLLENVSRKTLELGLESPVTLSIGLVPFEPSISSFHDIYELADSMLYKTKGSGKNGYRLYCP